jgi:hypothetical protein
MHEWRTKQSTVFGEFHLTRATRKERNGDDLGYVLRVFCGLRVFPSPLSARTSSAGTKCEFAEASQSIEDEFASLFHLFVCSIHRFRSDNIIKVPQYLVQTWEICRGIVMPFFFSIHRFRSDNISIHRFRSDNIIKVPQYLVQIWEICRGIVKSKLEERFPRRLSC